MNKINTKNKSTSNIYYLVFLVSYFLILIYLADKIYIWEDESYSLNTSSFKFSEVIRLSYNFEGQPPFYFLLLSLWRLMNSSIFFARLLSVIFIGGSAYFLQRLAILVTKRNNVRWLIVVFLLNPFTVWASLEIRLYALVILLSTICVFFYMRYYLGNKNKDLYILLIVSLIGLYTQYFFAFLITSFAFTLWIFKGRSQFIKFCIYFIPVVLLFLPNLIFVPDQLSMAQQHLNVNRKHIFDVLRTPQDFIMSLSTLPLEQYVRWIIKIPFILLFIFAFFKLTRDKTSAIAYYKNSLKILLSIICICMVLFIILIPSLSLIFQEKYMLITFTLFILLFLLMDIFQLRNYIFGAISLYFISILIIKYQYPEKTYNFKVVSNYLEKVELPNEPILFYGKSILPPFQYYYSGNNKLFPLPPINYDKDYYEERITDTAGLNNQITSINSATNSYILVTESITGFKYIQTLTKQMIEKSLKDRYLISLDTTFKSRNSENFLRVQRLEKR
ncbi:MAG: hypothetical protein ABI372_04850 [Ginsengibacter sp.]